VTPPITGRRFLQRKMVRMVAKKTAKRAGGLLNIDTQQEGTADPILAQQKRCYSYQLIR
jgi:hypothetical protein